MNGDLLHSQNTSKLGGGKSYDLNRFIVLEKWAPTAVQAICSNSTVL
jgi:hypothetical protein